MRAKFAAHQRWIVLATATGALLLGAGCSDQASQTTSAGLEGVLPTATPGRATSSPEPAASPAPPATLLPSPTPSPTACSEAWGSVIEESYSGWVIPMEIPLVVYLPPCYHAETRSYPVIYLLHGYPYNQSHWVDLGAVEAADRAIRQGMQPFIMVMPLQPEPLFRQTDGGPNSYESELVEGLLPQIDRRYRTTRSAGARYLGGISRGGIWALEIGLRNPELFDRIASYSPSLSVNYARQEYDPFFIASKADRLPSRILLVAGETDWALSKTEALYEALSERDDLADLQLEIVPGDHSNPTWESALELLFGFLDSSRVD